MKTDITISGMRTYTLKLRGDLDEDFATSFCPPETTLSRAEETLTLSNLHTDQSGLIGLIRQLHNLGHVIISLNSEQELPC